MASYKVINETPTTADFWWRQPLLNEDGSFKTDADGNIDWEKMHHWDTRTYSVVWETVIEGREPLDKDEEIVYNNMKNRVAYLKGFRDKMDYVNSMTSFWCHAYLDENGWVELSGPQFEWVKNFYERFVSPLPDDAKLTIFDCTRV